MSSRSSPSLNKCHERHVSVFKDYLRLGSERSKIVLTGRCEVYKCTCVCDENVVENDIKLKMPALSMKLSSLGRGYLETKMIGEIHVLASRL